MAWQHVWMKHQKEGEGEERKTRKKKEKESVFPSAG